MDYREQANLMQRDAEEFDGPGYIIGDLRQGAKSITDLLARAEAAEARAEKAERERDAAVKWIKEFTESIDRPCAACKHDTGDYVALGVCGGCSKDNNKWEWKGMEE